MNASQDLNEELSEELYQHQDPEVQVLHVCDNSKFADIVLQFEKRVYNTDTNVEKLEKFCIPIFKSQLQENVQGGPFLT